MDLSHIEKRVMEILISEEEPEQKQGLQCPFDAKILKKRKRIVTSISTI